MINEVKKKKKFFVKSANGVSCLRNNLKFSQKKVTNDAFLMQNGKKNNIFHEYGLLHVPLGFNVFEVCLQV